MKKIFKIIGLFLGLTVILYVTWINLPVTINRYSDIKFADKIIDQIEEYKKNKGLPESDDWETLKKFGFKVHADFLVPEYQKINKDNYELRFIEGFDGPYLLWNSKERKWKKDNRHFPTNGQRTNENRTYNKNYMSIAVSVRATKFAPDCYRGPQLGPLASGYSWEDWLP